MLRRIQIGWSFQRARDKPELLMAAAPEYLRQIYRRRFEETAAYRNRVWQVLTAEFFQAWIPETSGVLDLGSGFGEFINHIRAARKWAMDLNPDTSGKLQPGITLLAQDSAMPWPLPPGSLDVVFTSNFLEHLPDKSAVRQTLREAFGALKPGGAFIALGPNIKFLPGAYWDFFDHFVPLTELSLGEALEVEGFRMERSIPRFLPYTMVRGVEYPLFLLRLYLKAPLLWRIKGAQFLVIARKPA